MAKECRTNNKINASYGIITKLLESARKWLQNTVHLRVFILRQTYSKSSISHRRGETDTRVNPKAYQRIKAVKLSFLFLKSATGPQIATPHF